MSSAAALISSSLRGVASNGFCAGAGVYSVKAWVISFGTSTNTGPLRPLIAIWNARRIVSASSSTDFTMKLCFVMGIVIPVMSTSWKESRPSRPQETLPVMATSGIESM